MNSFVCTPCRNDEHDKCPAVRKQSHTWCDCQHQDPPPESN